MTKNIFFSAKPCMNEKNILHDDKKICTAEFFFAKQKKVIFKSEIYFDMNYGCKRPILGALMHYVCGRPLP
jgi:hypothetical protein